MGFAPVNYTLGEMVSSDKNCGGLQEGSAKFDVLTVEEDLLIVDLRFIIHGPLAGCLTPCKRIGHLVAVPQLWVLVFERDPVEMNGHVPVVVVHGLTKANAVLLLVNIFEPEGEGIVGDLLVLVVDGADDHRHRIELFGEFNGVAIGDLLVPVLAELD